MAMERVQGPMIGPKRDDIRAAQVTASIANTMPGRKKAVQIEDVQLRFELRGT